MIRKFLYLSGISLALLVSSCDEDEQKITQQQSDAVEDQSVAEAYFNDANDMSSVAVSSPTEDQFAGGRTKGSVVVITDDTRFDGAVVTIEPDPALTPVQQLLSPKGKITIDFGTGQTDSQGTVRKGKIIVTYSGWSFVVGSTNTLTFEGFEVDGVKVGGTRTVTTLQFDNTGITFQVEDADGIVTFEDGKTITRESEHTLKLTTENEWVLEGEAHGVTREGETYAFVITEGLTFKLECALNKFFLPAEGKATMTVGTQAIQIDYGTGTCDNKVTLTVNGFSQEITVED